MARKARERATSGIYRIVLRGSDMLFYCDEDAVDFLRILREEKEADFAEIYAYCLLNKQITLVIKEGLSGISQLILKICSRYAHVLKARHKIDGTIFKGRFISFALESNKSVLDAVRLTHRLPLIEGLSINYEWSSYPVYFKSGGLLESEAIVFLAGSQIDFRLYNERD